MTVAPINFEEDNDSSRQGPATASEHSVHVLAIRRRNRNSVRKGMRLFQET